MPRQEATNEPDEAELKRRDRLALAREARRVFGAPHAFRHDGFTDETEDDAKLSYRPVGIEDICELRIPFAGDGIELHVKLLKPETIARILHTVRQERAASGTG